MPATTCVETVTASCAAVGLLAGVTDDSTLSSSNIRPHFVLDSFGDLRAVAQQIQPAAL